ncbi:unnamed protein product [Nyctereutes procyonoides]|uniref:(raccoon dog) hypothetical protein n=1 Tax=Nyctereutes procyonoides TaxID=34880 RepID=A0A811XUG9_NYCPR|nr:unnamed protein product [Nyctereutes procyonoides]
MAWTPVLLGLLRHCTGSPSQSMLTQPSSLSASLETTTRLTCTLSSGFSIDSFVISWCQQKSGSPPWCLLYYYSDSSTYLGSEVPSCFSGSKTRPHPH